MVTWVPGHSVLHRLGHDMGGVVPDQFQRARIVAGDDLDLGVLVDRVGEVGEHAVERHRHGLLGERRRDALGDLEAGGAAGIFPGLAVGEGDDDLATLGGRLQIAERELESRGGRGRVRHRSLLWLTPANERG